MKTSSLALSNTAAQIAALKAGWMAVGAAFQSEHPACNEECPFYQSIAQRHPYGSGYATEYLCDCTLGQRASDRPSDCPAIQQTMEEA